VNLSSVHVKKRGLHVALVKGEESGFAGNGRVLLGAEALGSAEGFVGRFKVAHHPLCTSETKPCNAQLSVQ